MLMDIKCSAVTSIAVHLEFDDGHKKDRVIALGDLIEVEYNANGLRKKAEGKVINISTIGADPKQWYIILDGSDDFDSNKVRFSPMSILNVDIIRKADTLNMIRTPIGLEGVPYLRIIKGRLQYSKDGFVWKPINIDSKDVIEEAEGTVPMGHCERPVNDNTTTRGIRPAHRPEDDVYEEDGIEDAIY